MTLFRVAEGVDTGAILLQKRLPLGPSETAPEAYERICAATVDVVLRGCRMLAAGKARLRRQDESKATYTCSRTPSDGQIDWSRTTRRNPQSGPGGLPLPNPGAFTYHEGQRADLSFLREPVRDAPLYVGRIAGRVVRVTPGVGIEVLTGDGVIRVRKVAQGGNGSLDPAGIVRSIRARLGSSRGEDDNLPLKSTPS